MGVENEHTSIDTHRTDCGTGEGAMFKVGVGAGKICRPVADGSRSKIGGGLTPEFLPLSRFRVRVTMGL